MSEGRYNYKEFLVIRFIASFSINKLTGLVYD